MKILLTNDDGIQADGIYVLYQALKNIGEVFVVAPDSERSSVGHGITLSHPIFYKKFNKNGHFFGYGISGTPADCVKFAVSILFKEQKPDIIISGINLGPNEGCSIFYSGTVAGAREGALLGIPSIAVSLNTFVDPDYFFAAKFGAKVIKQVKKNSMPKGTFLNVNVPNLPVKKIKGVKKTKQCFVPIHGCFKKCMDPSMRDYYWMTGKTSIKKNDLTIDTYALNSDYITITPIQCDATNYPFLKDLNSWNFK